MKNVNMKNDRIKNILISSWRIYQDNYIIFTQIMIVFFAIFGLGIYVLDSWINFSELSEIYNSGSEDQLDTFFNELAAKDSLNSIIFFLISIYIFLKGWYLGVIQIAFLLNRNLFSVFYEGEFDFI